MRSQKGNIFFALFGAVAFVGVLGAATMTFMKGPLKTSVTLSRLSVANTQMQVAAQMAVLQASSQSDSGDCDSDGYVEPMEFKIQATGTLKPVGGGNIPDSLGATKTDPWGQLYGYCVWDNGTNRTGNSPAACDDDSSTTYERLAGSPNEYDTVLAIVSAGPDRTFATTCQTFADADANSNLVLGDVGDGEMVAKTGGSDDIILAYTYAEAASVGGGGLWEIKSGDPTTAEISKSIEFTGGMTMGDETAVTVCGASTANAMRYNTFVGTIQVCDGAGIWNDLSSSGAGLFELNTGVVRNTGDNTTEDFVFGSPQLADDGNANHDNRMFFDKSKGAFRAGGTIDTKWDDVNVGSNSIGLGYRTVASGARSVSFGNTTTASGDSSIAMGGSTLASGIASTAMGGDTTASGDYSTAMGNFVTAMGSRSTAMGNKGIVNGNISVGIALGSPTGAYPTVSGNESFGIFMGDQGGVDLTGANIMAIMGGDFIVGSPQLADDGNAWHDKRMFFDKSNGAFRAGGVTGTQWDTTASGDYSTAMGKDTTASGNFSTAMGGFTTASAHGSTAMGGFTTASGLVSTAMGGDTTASGIYSTAMGKDTTASGNESTAMGNKGIVSGNISVGIALGSPTGAYPTVSGNESFGIFMGDQGGVDLTGANIMAIMGGDVGVGTVAPTVGFKMDIIGDLRVQGSSTTCTIGDGSAATMCTSDRRLKDNIVPIENALDKISQLNGVTFNWKDQEKDQSQKIGVIAQDVEAVFPEIVSEDGEGMKTVDYAALVSPLIESVKALKADNKALHNKMVMLEKNPTQESHRWLYLLVGLLSGGLLSLLCTGKKNS